MVGGPKTALKKRRMLFEPEIWKDIKKMISITQYVHEGLLRDQYAHGEHGVTCRLLNRAGSTVSGSCVFHMVGITTDDEPKGDNNTGKVTDFCVNNCEYDG